MEKRVMEKNQFSRPAEYLRDGFLDADGNPIAGINGEYSLGIAYRLLDSGVTAADVANIRKALADCFETGYRAEDETPAAALPARDTTQLREAARGLGSKGAALDELFETAVTVVNDWRGFAMLIRHLERIQQQMSLLSTFRKPEPVHA